MGKQSDRGKLIEEYCRQNQKAKAYTLAKRIYDENKKIFSRLGKDKDIHNIRQRINYYRGHHGKQNRDELTKKELITPLNFDTNNKSHEQEIFGNILILDIETAPARGFFWDIWNQNIHIDDISNDWFVLTWAAKWLFEDKVYSGRLNGKEALLQDDKRIIRGVWEMLNKADIVVAHNGDKFDLPRLNTRFIIHGLTPPLPYQSIDTLKTVRRQFAFLSNKLDFVNRILNLPRKTETGRQLWTDCYNGNTEALKKMEEYNINDVRILEDTYLRLRPWIKPHPNVGLFILDQVHRCPSCGSDDLKWEGTYRTYANNFEAFRCNNCGAIGRKRKAIDPVDKKRHLTISVPK